MAKSIIDQADYIAAVKSMDPLAAYELGYKDCRGKMGWPDFIFGFVIASGMWITVLVNIITTGH